MGMSLWSLRGRLFMQRLNMEKLPDSSFNWRMKLDIKFIIPIIFGK
jgi:hypothetical protein